MLPTNQPMMADDTARSVSGESRAVWQAPQIVKIPAADANLGTRANNADGQFSTS